MKYRAAALAFTTILLLAQCPPLHAQYKGDPEASEPDDALKMQSSPAAARPAAAKHVAAKPPVAAPAPAAPADVERAVAEPPDARRTVVEPPDADVGAETKKPGQAPLAGVDALIAKGQLKAARSRLEKIETDLAEDDPLRVACDRRAGTISYREKDVLKARESFVAGIKLSKKLQISGPEAADCYLGLAGVLKAEGDVKNAIKVLQKALAAGPSPSSKKKIDDRLRRLQASVEAPEAANP